MVRRVLLPILLGSFVGVFVFLIVSRPHRAPAALPAKKRIVVPKVKHRAPLMPLALAAVGDMTFGTAGVTPPGGAGALLARVRRSLQSDLTVGNLETTLGTGGASKCAAGSTQCFSFQAPASTAVALKRAGFGAVNLANNHSDDYGSSGQSQTSAALRAAHVPYTGRPGQTT